MLSHPFNLITNWRQTTHQTVNFKKKNRYQKRDHNITDFIGRNTHITSDRTDTKTAQLLGQHLQDCALRARPKLTQQIYDISDRCLRKRLISKENVPQLIGNLLYTLHRRAKLITRLTEHLLTNDSD